MRSRSQIQFQGSTLFLEIFFGNMLKKDLSAISSLICILDYILLVKSVSWSFSTMIAILRRSILGPAVCIGPNDNTQHHDISKISLPVSDTFRIVEEPANKEPGP